MVLMQEPCRKDFYEPPSEASIVTLQARMVEMRPAFSTIMSFCTTLSEEMEWSITVLRLSQRSCPFPHSQGRVKAWLVQGPFPFWQGAAELQQQRSVRQRDHESSDRAEVHGDRNLSGEGDADENEEEAAEDGEEENGELDNLFGELPSAWNNPEMASTSESDEETSSSSSSVHEIVPATSGQGGSMISQQGELKPDSTAAVSGQEGNPIAPKRVADESLDSEAPAIKRDRTHHEAYGCHHITPRFVGDSLVGLQMTCRHHTHVNCSKEMSFSVCGGLDKCRQLLKAWILMGAGVRTRAEHMVADVKRTLLESQKAGILLPEADLDKLITATLDDVEPPFNAEIRFGDALPNSLGRKGDEVPLAVHQDMLDKVAAGIITPTTLEQRRRNKGTANSLYGVPPEFAEARRYGYVSPNLPAPKGLIWRARGGQWTLAPRGG